MSREFPDCLFLQDLNYAILLIPSQIIYDPLISIRLRVDLKKRSPV